MATETPDHPSKRTLGSLWRLLLAPARPFKMTDIPSSAFTPWLSALSRELQEWPLFDRAVVGGFGAPCLAFAFGSGYQMALRRLIPGLPPDLVSSLAASEEGGAHPRAIHSTIRQIGYPGESGFVLAGRKKWITLATEADLFLVAASAGTTPGGRNQIRIVQVPRDAPGLSVSPMKQVPFMPEISHGEVAFDNVRIPPEAILSGDGYADHLRPFRTAEDVFVSAALLGFLFRVAHEFGWPHDIFELLACHVASLHAIAGEDLTAPETHVAFGGVLAQQRLVLEQVDALWQAAEPTARDRWNRDKVILEVAGKARAARLDTAWKRLG